MEKFLLFLFSVTGASLLTAQTDINLNIFHKLGDQNFELFTQAENNLDQSFQVKRLEYYISQISLIHDGGTETTIEDMYILVDAAESTNVDLGNFDVTQMEAIRFHIGVEEAVNHNDPAAYPAEHPLAPQIPSMHWGWASGYRFIAFEGSSGPNLDQDCQIHALGDQNYFQTEITLDFMAENGSLALNLNADYTRGLEAIELNSGVFNHGFDEEALLLLENFRDYVFTQSNETVSINTLKGVNRFEVFPNPSNGLTNIELVFENPISYQLDVQTILGTTIRSYIVNEQQTNIRLELSEAGVYFLRLTDGSNKVLTKKLIVNK